MSLSARRAWIEMYSINEVWANFDGVALRKESVDRNSIVSVSLRAFITSLSARRAWIEMLESKQIDPSVMVALRKESVDRNTSFLLSRPAVGSSLSARRAWIEMSEL